MTDDPYAPTEAELRALQRAIAHFGGAWVDPQNYERSEADLQRYLDAVGAPHFSARELVDYPVEYAAEVRALGPAGLVPPTSWWPRAGALVRLLEMAIRPLTGPTSIRWWWRPTRINDLARGASSSDHLRAQAMDCYWHRGGKESQQRAEEMIRRLEREQPWLRFRVGHGDTSAMLHIGICRQDQSPAHWDY